MNIEKLREYCLSKRGTEETFPFDESTLVFKVMGKMFLLASLDEIPLRINIKCDPEKAIDLRERYDSVIPGYHMNKKYWNTVILDGNVPLREVLTWIDDSYKLVTAGLKKSDREELGNL